MINVKTTARTPTPNHVGHPSLDAIVPTNPDNNELTSLYVQGLKISNATKTV
jgi:hypothetical protein